MDSSWNPTGACEADQISKVEILVIRVTIIADSDQVPVGTTS